MTRLRAAGTEGSSCMILLIVTSHACPTRIVNGVNTGVSDGWVPFREIAVAKLWLCELALSKTWLCRCKLGTAACALP
eukprot:1693553-Rhodomonas_salina.1